MAGVLDEEETANPSGAPDPLYVFYLIFIHQCSVCIDLSIFGFLNYARHGLCSELCCQICFVFFFFLNYARNGFVMNYAITYALFLNYAIKYALFLNYARYGLFLSELCQTCFVFL